MTGTEVKKALKGSFGCPPVPDQDPVAEAVPIPTIESRMIKEREGIVTARDNARAQLTGLENQLYIIDKLLTPVPVPEELPEATEEAQEPPDRGVPMEPGTI